MIWSAVSRVDLAESRSSSAPSYVHLSGLSLMISPNVCVRTADSVRIAVLQLHSPITANLVLSSSNFTARR